MTVKVVFNVKDGEITTTNYIHSSNISDIYEESKINLNKVLKYIYKKLELPLYMSKDISEALQILIFIDGRLNEDKIEEFKEYVFRKRVDRLYFNENI